MKIENLNNCSGCSACYSICSKSAIIMKANEEGFLYPNIDKSKCVECGLCDKTCPAINVFSKNSEEFPIAYAAINNNEEIRLQSSSGGIFTAIAETVINEGGVVFGAKFSENFSVIHSWTDTIEGLADFRGSKYLQSVIGDSYKDCAEFLKKGRKVLFSGTPCQVQGVKRYLESKNFKNVDENLLTVDFICHGVPSPLLWQKYIEYREKKSASRTVKTAFRRKNDGWKQYSLSFTFANDSEYIASLNKDPYMQIFLKDIALRESCYKCYARGEKRVSDITLADFWGSQNIIPEMDDDKGLSFLIVHSYNGESIIEKINSSCTLKQVNLMDGINYNKAMINSHKYNNKRSIFFKDLEKCSFNVVINKYVSGSVINRGYNILKRYIKKIILWRK